MKKTVLLPTLCIALAMYSCGNEERESHTETQAITEVITETVTESYDFTKENESQYLSKGNGFLMSGKIDQAISLFSQMAENYPENKSSYLNSLGASYHMNQKYDKAIETYILSMEAGENASTIDDNIWESCEYKYKQDNDSSIMTTYLELFPEGMYIAKAKSILAS